MATTPSLVPFRADHLRLILPRDSDRAEALHNAKEKETRGPAFSAYLNGQILGCAGIQLAWPGMGVAWAMFGKELLEQWPVWTTRQVRYVIRDTVRAFRLHRIEMATLAGSERNQRWAEALGFQLEREGRARQFTTGCVDVLRYEFIVEESE